MRGPALALLLLAAASASPGLAADLAVIVNPANPVSRLSSADLRQILMMERQHWPGGERIYVLLPPAGTPLKDALLRRVFRMGDRDLRRHYLSKLYSGEIFAFPHVAASADSARLFVARTSNAIAVVETSAADDTVKVVPVQGLRPGDPGYPLSTAR